MQQVEARAEPGSFRDRDSRVFLGPAGVFRALSPSGLEDWEKLQGSALFSAAIADGRLVPTEVADVAAPPEILPEGAAVVLRHERIPFISYPYEWTFGMLRDAALLHLDLIDGALGEGMTLKDASPYNVQWRGASPVFADIGSFEVLRGNEPWVGYRQFCTLFLYPLMLQAYRGVPFQPWLRGSLEGITPGQMSSLLSARDRLRRGVLTHVALHARLERKHAAASRKEIKKDLRAAGFKPEIVQANVRRMRKLVEKLRWSPAETAWTGYAENRGYADADRAAKDAFVEAAARTHRPRLAWDIGTNDGAFARLVAPHAEAVVAMDFDQETVEHLYRSLREEGDRTIVPLVVDALDPSPARGWRGAERQTLEQRGAPDLTLALALVHHLSITGNVPLRDVVDWLASLGGALVVEFPTREDPMVQRLLDAKQDDAHPDYALDHFERLLEARFDVARREALPSGTRVLFEATPREA
jgi:hypothetical protein